MSLTQVSNGANVNATDIDQIINVLQQPSGGQEKGRYFLGGNAYTSSANVSTYIPTLSRGSTPISVTLDTVDYAPQDIGTPFTARLSVAGFQVLANSTTTSTHCNAAGNYTVQY